ncbi:MAG: hypothetical protein COB85_06530 [Bacteroidetes bacterium]|nr:MAG: hypothetical protein COB85_06530 [Bacteroidota bacterium]
MGNGEREFKRTLERRWLIVLLTAVSLNSSIAQTTYYSRGSGDWDVAATWSTDSCGGATAAASPSATDDAIVCSGHTVTLSNAGGTQTIRNVTIQKTSTLNLNNQDINVTGNYSNSGNHAGNTPGDIFLKGTTGSETIDGTGTISNLGLFRIEGSDKTILSTADLVKTDGTVEIEGGRTLTNNGIFTAENIEGSDATSFWVNGVNATLNIKYILLSAGSLTASASGNTINFFGPDFQTVTIASGGYYNLTISGAGNKDIVASTIVAGDLTINNLLDCDGYDLNIGGDWINNGEFVQNMAKVVFDGAGAQSITNTSIEIFYDLEIDKSSGTLTLNDNVTASNLLHMKAGLIDPGSNVLTLGTDITNEGTLTRTGGTIIGQFQRWINSASTATAFLFPVGTSSAYNYAQATFNNIMGTGGTITAQFVSSDPGSNGLSLTDGGITIYNSFVEGYWDLTAADGISSTSYDLDLAGNGFTSFSINSATRLLTRSGSGNAWTADGAHDAAVNPVAKRTGIGTLSAQYCFGDSTNCTGPSTLSMVGDNSVCTSESSVVYSYPASTTSTFTWAVTGGTINPAAGANDTSITVDWGGTGVAGNVSVVENNGCTNGATVNFSVTVHTLAPASVSGKTAIPENTTGEAYSVTNTTGYTYTWTITGGTQASGGSTNSITVDWGSAGTGTVAVVADSGSCSSSSSTSLSVNKYIVIESITTGDWDQITTWDCNCVPLSTDNVSIMNTHVVSLVANTTVDNFVINAGGSLSAGIKQFTVTGNITIDGSYVGTNKSLIISGANTDIDGVGTISLNSNTTISITSGSKTILSTTSLRILQGDLSYGNSNITITNNGSITVVDNIMGGDATMVWTNAANSTLNVGAALLDDGTLNASATGNTVRYMGNAIQTVKTPSVSTYYNLTADSSLAKTTLATLTISNDLNVSSSAIINLGGHLDIDGDLLVSGTAQLDVTGANYEIVLAGDWSVTSSNANPFVEQNGAVTFDGSTTQKINDGSANDERFYDVVVNKSGGNINLTTNTDITIVNSLTFTQGIIEAETSTDYVLFLDNATSNGGDADSYVDGKVRKTGNDAFAFPVGDSTIWARLEISAPDDVGDIFDVQYFHTAHADANNVDATLNNSSMIEYWDLTEVADAGGATSINVKLYFENAGQSGIDDCADLTIAHYTTGFWREDGPSTANGACTGSGSGNVLTDNPISTFSPFSFGSRIGSKNPLPVTLLSFNATLDEDAGEVNLAWITSSESNNNYFTIERSIDGVDYEFVTYVEGGGTTNETRYYNTIDPDPHYGLSYYRLRQTDYDGVDTTFWPVAVNYVVTEDAMLTIAIYPNPTQGQFFVNIKGKKNAEVLVVVRDILGKEHYSKIIVLENNGHTLAIDPSEKLSAGVYLIVASSNNKLYNKKLVVR